MPNPMPLEKCVGLGWESLQKNSHPLCGDERLAHVGLNFCILKKSCYVKTDVVLKMNQWLKDE